VQLPACNEMAPQCGFNRIRGSRTSRAIRLECRPSGAATPDLATIWNNFRIRKASTRMVFSKTIEFGHFFLQWREARSMLILGYGLMLVNGPNL
jgi:hypothetical protein